MDGKEILIVANKTLGGQQLVDAARERVKAGAAGIWIVVPATPLPEEPPGMVLTSIPDADVSSRQDAYSVAEAKLDRAKGQFNGLGVPVGGEVGDEDPVKAVGDVLSRREIGEVMISILPRSVSHWLRIDLPTRVQRKYSVPVTTVSAPAAR